MKNLWSTTDGTESSSGSSGKDALGKDGRGGQGFRDPLTGFSKSPQDESVLGMSPQMMAKADARGMDSIENRRTREDARRQLADIYFAFDRWGLSDEGRKNLSESARFLKDHPKAKLLIEGHCDERGSGEYNLALGEKRAKEAKQYLADLGIHNPVAVTSFGKERPACTEQDESCYSRNRRAHLLVESE
jgi:peptidoglycan-associated lipoprotein